MAKERLYNVFNEDYEKVNEKPLTGEEAERLRNKLNRENGYDMWRSPIKLQGIYPPTRQGWNDFLDEMGWESYGQHYDSFIYAMKNDELYCM